MRRENGVGESHVMERKGAPTDFGIVWKAIENRLPAGPTPMFRLGLAGEIVRGAGKPLLASDITHLLMPGLAALGIEARLLPWESGGENAARIDTEQILVGFAAPLLFSPPEEINDATPLPGDTDPPITAMEVGTKAADAEETLPSLFSYRLVLQRSETKMRRKESVQAALYRWLAWYAAYPERAPLEADSSDPVAPLAAAFLMEVVGTRRDFVSNRLRYAARCLEAAQIAAAYGWLREAGVAAWQLPAAGAQALLSAPEHPLSNTLRQELIYLARAGTLPLKTLAARRLTYELHHPDARKTLHQLRFDPSPWVRVAARPHF